MKKIMLLAVSLMLALAAFSQAKKPTIMVVPSDAWCNENGYVTEYDNQGAKSVIPDYARALQNDINLKMVISTINDLMAERGFPLKDLEATLKSINQNTAEDNLTMSKTSGATLAESPLDRLRRTAKADIIIEITWSIENQGPKTVLTYIMEGKDSYTNKSIGSANGVSAPSFSATTAQLLQEAVLAQIDNFNNRLQSHFDDLLTNGREVALEVRVFDNGAGVDMETEFNGEELGETIDNWMATNTVSGRFSKLDGSENLLRYEQVRIPLYKENGMAIDTEGFARMLRSFLKKAPYNLTCKVVARGLGKAVVIIGEK